MHVGMHSMINEVQEVKRQFEEFKQMLSQSKANKDAALEKVWQARVARDSFRSSIAAYLWTCDRAFRREYWQVRKQVRAARRVQ